MMMEIQRVSDPLYVARLAEPSGKDPVNGFRVFKEIEFTELTILSHVSAICMVHKKRVSDPLYVARLAEPGG